MIAGSTLLAGVACTAALAGGSVVAPRFGVAQTVATLPLTDSNLQEIAAGDVTGDGIADVIVTHIAQTPRPVPVTILAGDGKGHFTDRTNDLFAGPVPEPVFPRRTVLADFNGDGRLDVLIADTGPDAQPFPGYPSTLILSAPGGKLVDGSAGLPRRPGFTHSAAVADVNEDGAPDIYLGNLLNPADTGDKEPPEIVLNDGRGNFRVADGALPDDVRQYHYDGSGFADVNGDGHADLVLAGSPGTPNRLLLGDGHAHFADLPGALPAKPWGLDSEGLTVNTADLNGDQHADLLIGYTKNTPYYVGRWLQVLIGAGNGTLRDETATRLPQADNAGEWPYKVDLADLNGDGKLDIGVSVWWYPPDAASIYLNQGNGTFAPYDQSTLGAPLQPSIAFLDANRDGRLDIFETRAGRPEVHAVLLQVGPVVKPKPKPTPKKKPRPKPKKKAKH